MIDCCSLHQARFGGARKPAYLTPKLDIWWVVTTDPTGRISRTFAQNNTSTSCLFLDGCCAVLELYYTAGPRRFLFLFSLPFSFFFCFFFYS